MLKRLYICDFPVYHENVKEFLHCGGGLMKKIFTRADEMDHVNLCGSLFAYILIINMEERYSLNDVLNVVEARYPRVELPQWNL